MLEGGRMNLNVLFSPPKMKRLRRTNAPIISHQIILVSWEKKKFNMLYLQQHPSVTSFWKSPFESLWTKVLISYFLKDVGKAVYIVI